MHCQTSLSAPDVQWYALRTRSRQEKAAAARLSSVGISNYLPLKSELRQWSDRKQEVQVPLFPGYVFVHLDVRSGSRLEALKTPGIVGFVGNASGPLPIPEKQIESVRTVVSSGSEFTSQTPWKEGDRVRVVRGPLAGVEGILDRRGSKSQLVITIEMIQRSVALVVAEDDLELAVEPTPATAQGEANLPAATN